MVAKQFYELIKERKPNLENISKKWDSSIFNGIKENPSILELESCLKEQVSQTKKQGLELMKKHKNKILYSSLIVSISAVGIGIYSQFRLIKYRRLCMEMAKIDHDIATYVIESSILYNQKTMHLRPEKEDIRYRYKLYRQLNRGKSLVTIQKERNELQARRVKEAHEFNFDLMRVRHESTNYRTDKC